MKRQSFDILKSPRGCQSWYEAKEIPFQNHELKSIDVGTKMPYYKWG